MTDLLGALARQAERDARARRRGRSAPVRSPRRPLTDPYLPAWSEPFVGDRREPARAARPDLGHGSRGGVRRVRRERRDRGDRRLRGRTGSSGRRRQAHPERPGRARRRGSGRGRRSRGDRRRRARDGLRGDHPRPRSGRRHRVDPGPRPGQPRQGNDLRGRPRVGDRRGRDGDQPQPVVEERGPVRRLPRDRRPGVLRQRPPGQRRQQRPGPELSVALLVGRVGRGPRRRRPVDVVLQPAPAGRVRSLRGGRRGRLEGRRADGRDREQLRRAAHRRAGGADPGEAPRRHAVRGQGDPGGRLERGSARAADRTGEQVTRRGCSGSSGG